MAEYIDIFDANMSPVAPFRMERGDVTKHGHWHHVFDCWIMRRDPAGDKMLLQLRSATKAHNPGLLDISAAGWLQSGETHADGYRELEEELGIKVNPTDLYYLGMSKEAVDKPGHYTRSFCHTYFYESTLRPEEYKPQTSEVDGVFEIGIADGIRLFGNEIESVTVDGIVRGVPEQRTITRTDLCSFHDRCVVTRYYLKIFLLAGLFLKGQRPLII